MQKKCFDCGKVLKRVPRPSFLNSDQWDAEKAGDYFATCENATNRNGNCYFRDTLGIPVLKKVE